MEYKPHDSWVVLHEDDPDLDTIRIRLPDPPPLKKIDGYGLPPEQQYWRAPTMPPRLKDVQRKQKTLARIEAFLRTHQEEYADELAWIALQWERRLNGYWLFINGKPTYMDGWHYFYCGFWHLDVGLPKYRDRDRKFFHAARWCYTTTTLPNGHDMGRRIVLGLNYAKHRREGATYRAACISFEIISRSKNAVGGIQAMDGATGRKAFREKVVQPWRKMVFFFKPLYSGNTDPKSDLEFDVPAEKVSKDGAVASSDMGLGSKITYAPTANRGYFDGDKLYVYHGDECGKTVEENVEERHRVIRRCCAQDNNLTIHGFVINTSTVGEMKKMGGKNFYDLTEQSHYSERDPVTGQTKSGLINIFIPAWEGSNAFLDIFGGSIIEDPTEEFAEKFWPNPVRDGEGKLVGAKRSLESQLLAYLKDDSPGSIEKYSEELRLAPTKWRHCFGAGGSTSGFNVKKIALRLDELRMQKDAVRRGNFVFSDGVIGSRVMWVDNPEGRWELSKWLDPQFTNLKVRQEILTDLGRKTVWFPARRGIFTASADPFKFRKTANKKQSMGAGSVFWNRDKSIDPDERPIAEWESNRNVCIYNYRTLTPDEYAMDMLAMCIYFGADMFPEINIPLVWDKFIDWGYEGYLMYRMDLSGKWATQPGWFNRDPHRESVWQAHQAYIELHSHREMHASYLEQAFNISSVDEMTDNDIFTSVGGGLYGSQTDYRMFNPESESQGIDIGKLFPKRRY